MMSLQVKEELGGKVVRVHVSDSLTKEDYERFVPEIERRIDEHGKIRVLFDMQEFDGWNSGGLWEDIKFSAGHFNDIERLAMVGEKKWQEWMSTFCKPFTSAEIRFFEEDEGDQAHQWLLAE
jgi:hypothetical protein